MISSHPKKVLVVGDGYLPYLISLGIQKKFKQNTPELVLIDLGKPSQTEFLQSLGSMKHFHSELGMSETEFVKSTKAEINLGFDYSGFSKAGGNEMFCDAQYGFDLNNRRFFHLFNKLRQINPTEKLETYCLTAHLARSGRFTPPSPKARSVYAGIHYGYRLTGDAYAEFLKSQLPASGIRMLHAQSLKVTLDDRGFISSIDIPGAGTLEGDLFIDASEGRVIKNTLTAEHSLQPLLPSDWNLTIHGSTEPQDHKLPNSKIEAKKGSLQISGCHRGLEYKKVLSLGSSQSNARAPQTLFVDQAPWVKNCIVMGHAFTNRESILIENSHFNQNMLLRLLELWPRSTDLHHESQAYNHSTLAEFKHLHHMDLLHLALALGQPGMLPDEMHYKLDTFEQIGKVVYYEKELLQEDQWPVLFNALGLIPATVDLSAQACTHEWLSQELLRIGSSLAKAAEAAPLYHDFICAAHR